MYDDLDDDIMLGAEAMVVLPSDLDLPHSGEDAEPLEGPVWMRTRAESDVAMRMTVGEEDRALHEMVQRIFAAHE